MNVAPVPLEICAVSNPMIRKAPLPNFDSGTRLLHEAMRIAAFNELHRSFQRDRGIVSEEKMNMIGHDHEFVELKDSAVAIVKCSVYQNPCGRFGLEQGSAPPSHKGYEEYTIGEVVHSG